MDSAVEVLKTWFKRLSDTEQQEVLKFLYGGKALLRKGQYVGPYPSLVTEGLHCGPAPQSGGTCPTCGRPL